MDDDTQFRDAVLRQDFASFVGKVFETVDPGAEYLPNWHIEAIAEYLGACERGELTRLLINMPPRALKSVSVSVAWPAWLLGHGPERRIVAASYAQSLALKHSLDSRLVVQALWYQRLFPWTRLVAGQNEKHKFVTTQRGFRLATSVGASIIGEGGNFLIVDDPLNPRQAMSKVQREAANGWFDHGFVTRLDDKKRGVIVVVMQRLHVDDLSGHVLERGGWEHLCLPAVTEIPVVVDFGAFSHVREAGSVLHPEREGEAEIARMKRELGSQAFAAQYQQAPVLVEGGMMQSEWFRRYKALPEEVLRVVQSWDTGIKAQAVHDASVCTTWVECEDGYYLIDVAVMRLEYPALKKAVGRLAEQFVPHAILIEDKASGQSLLQDLRRDTALPVIAIQPRGDKVTRFAAVSAMVEAGRVWLPQRAAWLVDFETELYAFPHGAHDDQVDSFSQFLAWVRGKRKVEPGVRGL